MVLIKVKPEEKAKVFEILATNGKFMGLSDNRFNIIEHEEEVLEKLKNANIEPEILE